jgi:hypothetical protein
MPLLTLELTSLLCSTWILRGLFLENASLWPNLSGFAGGGEPNLSNFAADFIVNSAGALQVIV